MDGTRLHGLWSRDFVDGGVCGEGVQQYPGRAATCFRVRECAAVCDIHAGDVLEAHHRTRSVLGIAGRNGGGGDALWIDAAGGSRWMRQGREYLAGAGRVYECDGATILHSGVCFG